jgi:hypothetical protein
MDKCPPDLYDVLGSLVIVAGVETIMYWPRGRLKEGLAGQGKQFELKRRVISKRSFLIHLPYALTGTGARITPTTSAPLLQKTQTGDATATLT